MNVKETTIIVDLPGIEPGPLQCECSVVPFNHKPQNLHLALSQASRGRGITYYLLFFPWSSLSGPEGNRTPYSSMPWKHVTGIPRALRILFYEITRFEAREVSWAVNTFEIKRRKRLYGNFREFG
jgi:hypothetical protein